MIKEITMFEFDEFVQKNELYNLYQTSSYAIFKAEENYDYEYLGYFENNNLVAATLILYKNISLTTKYGYAPRGFILDYHNLALLNNFTIQLKAYLKKQKFIFLKTDPLLVTREYDAKTNIIYQESIDYKKIFTELGYIKLKDNLYFESQLPRFDGYIDLENFDLQKVQKNTRNKIKKALKKGLILEKISPTQLDILYQFIAKKKNKSFKYYNDLERVFANNKMIDLFLVKVDYEKFMEDAKNNYEEELIRNEKFNELLKINPSEKNLNNKMKSDNLLTIFKNNIMEASSKYSNQELEPYVGGAIVIKTGKTCQIFISGYDKNYQNLNVNYFLYYKIIEYYQQNYKFLNIDGLTGDFTHDNPYYGLNRFKLGFKPQVYEFIGELDLVINEKVYDNLRITGKLHQIFDLKN